jgi:DNA polymerase V
MVDVLCCDMYAKNIVARGFSWWVSYDWKSLEECPEYDGPVVLDFYGRLHPRHHGGTVRLRERSNSFDLISAALLAQFDKKTDHRLLFRRLSINAMDTSLDDGILQLDMFMDYAALEKEKRIQGALMDIRTRFGKNAVIKGMNLMEGATTIERNRQIGGHNAGL